VPDAVSVLAPDPVLLAVGVAIDLALGDPVYAWHPVRIVGRSLSAIEGQLRRANLDGYGGGILLFLILGSGSLVVASAMVTGAAAVAPWFGLAVHAFLVYSFLALGDLTHHVWRIERAVRAGELPAARHAVSALVGRDTDRMDDGACRRAAVESLSESLTDGFVSPVGWYLIGGIPGLVLFKVVSTMDSMVGYKTPRYLRFGWCGARLDDVMNYLPARVAWLVIAVVAAIVPRCSSRKAFVVGLRQHAIVLGPNSGWSEAAIAGALQRRVVGPIWLKGALVTDVWIGDASDPPLESAADVTRALTLVVVSGVVVAAAGVWWLSA
jgi:adenosylcobinamide-phosphate synthase